MDTKSASVTGVPVISLIHESIAAGTNKTILPCHMHSTVDALVRPIPVVHVGPVLSIPPVRVSPVQSDMPLRVGVIVPVRTVLLSAA